VNVSGRLGLPYLSQEHIPLLTVRQFLGLDAQAFGLLG
jgi:hypothetical protein